MTSPQELQVAGPLTLSAATAADLMTPNPVPIDQNATVKEAVVFLTDRGISAAPVIDESGRPVGVVSLADIVIHHRHKVEFVPAVPAYSEKTDLATSSGEPRPGGSQVGSTDQARVRDIMTPVVFSVSSEAPARRIVGDILGLKVHRVFVVDAGGVLVGVVSAFDVLRHLR
ncbi:MAG TPA: CBS domain-containing protein [Fimbriiglobus sp.]|nr:CBS domain-containing protein [Fimbriiglobus sp.]